MPLLQCMCFNIWIVLLRGNNKLQELVEEMSQKNILYFQTPTLTIHNPKLAPLHIDGEPAETASSFQITLLKHCFDLIQPAMDS